MAAWQVKLTKSEWQLAIDETKNVQLRLDIIDQAIGRYRFAKLDNVAIVSDLSVPPAAERRGAKRGGPGGQRNAEKSRKVAASTSDREWTPTKPEPQSSGSVQRKGKRARKDTIAAGKRGSYFSFKLAALHVQLPNGVSVLLVPSPPP